MRNREDTFNPEVIDFDAHLDCYWCPLVFKTRAKLIAHYNKKCFSCGYKNIRGVGIHP